MDFQIKDGNGLTINAKSATIKLEKWRDSNPINNQELKHLKALSILLGGYNKFGRKIPLDQHRDNMIVFKDLIEKISNQLD